MKECLRAAAISAPDPMPATVNLQLHQRLPDTHRQVGLSLLCSHCSFLLGSGVRKVLYVPSKDLSWVWGLILYMTTPRLPSCCSFSFVFGCRVSFFWWAPISSCQRLFNSYFWFQCSLRRRWVHILLLSLLEPVFLSSPSGTLIMQMSVCLMLSQKTLRLSSFFSFFFYIQFYSNVSTFLSFRSLICSLLQLFCY